MVYTFSWSAFFIGGLILLGGAALVVWYRQIADTLGHGTVSYERYRLYGLLACLLGFIIMFNLHSLLLNWFFGLFFGNKN